MTLLVGILCTDGVVVASDSAATFGTMAQQTIGQQTVRKVVQVNDHMIYCGTGAVGIGQVMAEKIKQMWDANSLRGPSVVETMNKVGHTISNTVRPYLETAEMGRKIGVDPSTSICKSMVAFPITNVPCLFSFDYNGAPEQATPDLPFVAMGSGQVIADPFLAFLKRVLWKDSQPSLAEGRLAAVWTIVHVARTNPGGVGGPIQLATLSATKPGTPRVTMLTDQGDGGIQEHLARVESAEQALLREVQGIQPGAAQDVPNP